MKSTEPIVTEEGPGGGVYDHLCQYVLDKTQARGVLLIVLGGNRGQGFSAAVEEHIIPDIPEILRQCGDSIQRIHKNESIPNPAASMDAAQAEGPVQIRHEPDPNRLDKGPPQEGDAGPLRGLV